MTWPHAENGSGPGPELLAAYADGELDGTGEGRALRERVEAWLSEHPEAAAEVAALQRLRAACQATAPADPGDEVLDAVRERVRLAVAAGRGRPILRRLLIWGSGGTAAAVAAWLALTLLPGPPPRVPTPAPAVTAAVAPLPVASADEVEILHVQGADTDTLVVGAPPVEGPLELAGPGDVTLKSVQPAQPDNMVPDMMLDGPTPMIWARADGERE